MNDALTLDELRARVKEFATPSNGRAFFEVGITLVLFFALLVLAGFASTYSAVLAIGMGIPTGLFLVRLFVLQHDCGHRSLFKTQWLNLWFGRLLATLCLTPFREWLRSHLTHHRHTGQLDVRRGEGNIWLYTTDEFAKQSSVIRFLYRVYHSRVVLHLIGPTLLFVVYYRCWWVEKDPDSRRSMIMTNVAIACALSLGVYAFGWYTLTLVLFPTVFVASTVGAWAFYVQHTFPDAYFAHEGNFDKRKAIMAGCSYVMLPRFFEWLTGWIGHHSIHHLNPSIPSYRLRACFQKYKQYFMETPTFTIAQTFRLTGLALWSEQEQKMVRL